MKSIAISSGLQLYTNMQSISWYCSVSYLFANDNKKVLRNIDRTKMKALLHFTLTKTPMVGLLSKQYKKYMPNDCCMSHPI